MGYKPYIATYLTNVLPKSSNCTALHATANLAAKIFVAIVTDHFGSNELP
jgi:hypothetical protein